MKQVIGITLLSLPLFVIFGVLCKSYGWRQGGWVFLSAIAATAVVFACVAGGVMLLK